MKLTKSSTLELQPLPPFDFDSTFHKPDHFTSGDNEWQPGIRWQTKRWPSKLTSESSSKPLGLKFIDRGTVDEPLISVEIYSNQQLEESSQATLEEELRYLFNLDLDISKFYDTFRDDAVLQPIITKWRGMRPGHPSSLYEYLIIGIVLQNATVKRSVQMFQTLLEKHGERLDYDDKQLWCFWPPGGLAETSEEDLRQLKVGYRAKYIKEIDNQFREGRIKESELRGQELTIQKETLLDIYGIGPATVWYILFDVFHRWGHFEHISPWEQKIYSKLFFDQDPENPVAVEDILDHFQRYGQYKHLAVHYIWEDLWWKRKHKDIPWLEKLIKI